MGYSAPGQSVEPSRIAGPRQGPNGLTVAVTPDMRSTNRYQELLASALEQRGIRVRFPEQLGGRRPVLRALLSRQFDVLHLDWIHPYVTAETLPKSLLKSTIFVLKLLLARLLGCRIVWTVHNVTGHDARFGSLERTVSGLVAALAHGLVVHFPAAEQIVRSSFRVSPAKEVYVAHHGHYIDVYPRGSANQGEETQRAPSPPLMVLTFGLVRPYKRIEELMMALRMLKGNDVHIRVRGMASDEEYAAELACLGRDDNRIDLDLGFIEDESVARLYDTADLVAITQTDTLTSGSLILAMSMGKPVVAARTAHAEYLLGDGEGGVLYTSGDLEELASALESLTDRRDELSGMGSANQRAIAYHTWSRMAEGVERAYRGTK